MDLIIDPFMSLLPWQRKVVYTLQRYYPSVEVIYGPVPIVYARDVPNGHVMVSVRLVQD